jgi:hypothetical protein
MFTSHPGVLPQTHAWAISMRHFMDWSLELIAKAKDQNIISYLLLKNGSGKTRRQR